MLLLFFAARYVLTRFTWYRGNPLYEIFHWISNHADLLLIFLGSLGFVVIFLYQWLRTLGYLEDIIEATQNVYDSKEELIVLPTDLKDVENRMNQIKMNIRENERTAKDAEQRKNDLIVYLAHDLKTPLTSVIGYLTLLRDENEISAELREKYLAIALNKAERLEDLINEFFEITRFNLSNLTIELSRVNFSRMLEQMTYEYQPMFAEKGLHCNLNMPADLEIRCDVDKIQRVLDNLLRKAINYSFPNQPIGITLIHENGFVTLHFSNHGNTIPSDKLNRIFEQFYRLDTARTSKTGGAGLGLAIAKQIVELHGGTITAFSDNEIIQFTIKLPEQL
jgi:two-component system sensor histidine kinase VanS